MINYLEKLNPMQKKAVLHIGSPLLILAGAGSGKTRVITTKIAYILDSSNIKPYEILAVTFTKKACAEMRERAIQMNKNAKDVVIRTFHSFGAKILRNFSNEIGLDNSFSILDDTDALSLLKSTFPDLNSDELKKYARLISRAKDYNLYPEDDLTQITDDTFFFTVYKKYQERLKNSNCVDFGDLIGLNVRLLKNSKKVKDFITQRYKVILIDEYQDSNVAQYELIKNMVTENNYLCVVGDDDQSIYKFRGAEVQNILNFSEYFKNTEIIKLEQNYRSTSTILKIASEVISNNSDRLGKTLWTENSKDGIFEINEFENYEEEANYIVNILKDNKFDSTAVLYRTNSQSLIFETIFARKNIPFKIIGALRFYDREEIKDVIAYLSLLTNPKNEIAFTRIINKPSRKTGKGSIEKIMEESEFHNHNLLDACENFAEKNNKKDLLEFINLHREIVLKLNTISLSAIIQIFLSKSGLLDYFKKEDAINLTNKCENLNELINVASTYTIGKEGILEFLEDIELDATMSDKNKNVNGVSLITMHNTKGLEFDRVFITGMEDSVFPSSLVTTNSELEEERRLFYVAITRAKKDLYMSFCRQRRIWGKTQYLEPSIFLSELPKEFIPVPKERAKFKVGTWVYHDDYGRGKIIKQWFNGEQDIVIILFETGFQGQFFTKYTNLEKLDSSW